MQHASTFLIRIHFDCQSKTKCNNIFVFIGLPVSSKPFAIGWTKSKLYSKHSHCIRFANSGCYFWCVFFFLSLPISRIIYTNLDTKIICASYELDEALIEKGICMLNSLFIHILHPKIKFKLQTNMKKKYVYKTEFHMHNRSNFLLFHNEKFIHRRIFRAMVSISLSYFDGTKSFFPF